MLLRRTLRPHIFFHPFRLFFYFYVLGPLAFDALSHDRHQNVRSPEVLMGLLLGGKHSFPSERMGCGIVNARRDMRSGFKGVVS
jgi:hypothetical protein